MTKNKKSTISLNANANANANAVISVTAKKSQSLIIILAITMSILSVIGCFLLYEHNDLYWVPFIFAGVLLIACMILALVTHKNTDLAGAHATIIESGGPGGFRIAADPRVNISSKQIVPILSVLANMHTLPEASGFVDEKLNPIPNTEHEARKKVENINLEARQACADSVKNLNSLPVSEPLMNPNFSVSNNDIGNSTPQEYTYLERSDIIDS